MVLKLDQLIFHCLILTEKFHCCCTLSLLRRFFRRHWPELPDIFLKRAKVFSIIAKLATNFQSVFNLHLLWFYKKWVDFFQYSGNVSWFLTVSSQFPLCFHNLCTVSCKYSDAASGWAEWALAHPEFGRSVNPITTREADYAHHITTSPPGFENPAASLHINT